MYRRQQLCNIDAIITLISAHSWLELTDNSEVELCNLHFVATSQLGTIFPRRFARINRRSILSSLFLFLDEENRISLTSTTQSTKRHSFVEIGNF